LASCSRLCRRRPRLNLDPDSADSTFGTRLHVPILPSATRARRPDPMFCSTPSIHDTHLPGPLQHNGSALTNVRAPKFLLSTSTDNGDGIGPQSRIHATCRLGRIADLLHLFRLTVGFLSRNVRIRIVISLTSGCCAQQRHLGRRHIPQRLPSVSQVASESALLHMASQCRTVQRRGWASER